MTAVNHTRRAADDDSRHYVRVTAVNHTRRAVDDDDSGHYVRVTAVNHTRRAAGDSRHYLDVTQRNSPNVYIANELLIQCSVILKLAWQTTQ